MGVSKKGGTPKSSILIGCSFINHPFWGTPILGNTHIGNRLGSSTNSNYPAWNLEVSGPFFSKKEVLFLQVSPVPSFGSQRVVPWMDFGKRFRGSDLWQKTVLVKKTATCFFRGRNFHQCCVFLDLPTQSN